MKKVIRVGTYPTSDYKSMGRNSFMISGMDTIKTIFVAPKYQGIPLPVKKYFSLYIFIYYNSHPKGYKENFA